MLKNNSRETFKRKKIIGEIGKSERCVSHFVFLFGFSYFLLVFQEVTLKM